MKIVQYYGMDKATDIIEVVSAVYIGNYVIDVSFSDGNEKRVDFERFLTKARHPSILKYLDETLFKQFGIVNGNLNWNDYDLIFPIHDLYEGVIQ